MTILAFILSFVPLDYQDDVIVFDGYKIGIIYETEYVLSIYTLEYWNIDTKEWLPAVNHWAYDEKVKLSWNNEIVRYEFSKEKTIELLKMTSKE